MPDTIYIDIRTCELTLSQMMVEIARLQREFPQYEIFMDGDRYAIGLLHTQIGGPSPYAPCSLTDLKESGMDYWALGHVHAHQILSEKPYIVYAGSPQGLDCTETGAHGCAIAAAAATGDYNDIPSAVNAMTHLSDPVLPQSQYFAAYDKKYSLYKRVIEALEPVWDSFL